MAEENKKEPPPTLNENFLSPVGERESIMNEINTVTCQT